MTPTIEGMKREAKRIARATTVTHAQALNVLAVQQGFTHWKALADSIASPSHAIDRSNDDGSGNHATTAVGLHGALEITLGRRLPTLAGSRHLIVSGAEATGKTTLLSLLLGRMVSSVRVASIEYTREFRLPEGAVALTFSRTAPNMLENEREALADALAGRPDVVVFGGTSATNVASIVDLMSKPNGPMVATIVHASGLGDANEVIRRQLRHADHADLKLPGDVALIQMERHPFSGKRMVSDMSMAQDR